MVLCLKASIAKIAPSQPQARLNIKSVFSLILHFHFLAFHLSIPRTIKVILLISIRIPSILTIYF